MNVREAHRTRHLVIRLDRGDELPASLVRALDEAEARSGFITGVGTLDAAVLGHQDPLSPTAQTTRRIDAPSEVVSLSGNVALLDGAASVRLSAVLARETDVGLGTFGGQLVWARALALELSVVVFDDLALTRVADERTGLPVLEARPAGASALGAPTRAAPVVAEPPSPSPPPVAAVETHRSPTPPIITPPPAAAPHPPAPSTTLNDGPALPLRHYKPKEELETYPEVGDIVVHFHFGECVVVSSDGDRIRLRQDRDGRVLDVALTKLRIEPPTIAEDGTRRFKLHRKN